MRRAALCLLLAAALVGCGDSSMSPADYRAEAKRICTDADRATNAIKPPTKATPAAIVDYFKRLLAANDRTTRRFEKLDPPKKLEKAHKDVLAANTAGVAEVKKIVADLQGGKDPRDVLTGAQTRLRDLSVKSRDASKRLGVPACADR